MSIPSPINIGWARTQKDYRLAQGSYGEVSLTVKAIRSDGTPYPTYTGFTGVLSIYTLSERLIATLSTDDTSIVITPSPSTQEITIKIIFNSNTTLLFPSDTDLIGDLLIICPDGIEKQYPFQMKLRVFRTYTRIE